MVEFYDIISVTTLFMQKRVTKRYSMLMSSFCLVKTDAGRTWWERNEKLTKNQVTSKACTTEKNRAKNPFLLSSSRLEGRKRRLRKTSRAFYWLLEMHFCTAPKNPDFQLFSHALEITENFNADLGKIVELYGQTANSREVQCMTAIFMNHFFRRLTKKVSKFV